MKRSNILKGANYIKDQVYMQSVVRQAASAGAAKTGTDQKLLPSEQVAMAKANEGAVVAQAQSGAVAQLRLIELYCRLRAC